MGLAASQARLLTITARKSDCEFLSMTYSHQKIALARDMEAISDEYQAALNKTKLVYDYYGSGMSQMNLDYNLLMTPSLYNDYYPKLLTDRANRIILDSKYASAAKAAGIPAEGYRGTPSSVIRNRFIEALADSGAISGATAIATKSVTYNNAVGLGGGISASISTQDISGSDLLDLIKKNCEDTKDYQTLNLKKGSDYPIWYYRSDFTNDDYNQMRVYENLSVPDNSFIPYSNMDYFQVSLYDLLTSDNQYVYQFTTTRGPTVPVTEAAYMQEILVGNENSNSFLNWMTDQFSSILGGVSTNDQALQYAYNQVYDLIYPNEKIQEEAARLAEQGYHENDSWKPADATIVSGDGDQASRHDLGLMTEDCLGKIYIDEIATKVEHNYDRTRMDEVTGPARAYIGLCYSSCGSGARGGKNRRQTVAVDLNTLAKVFLTAFKEYLGGLDNSTYSYELGQTLDGRNGNKASLYNINEHKDDIFTIVGTTDVNSASDSALAGFYDALFNLICTHGWTENDKITDSAYMQEVLKNGSVFISNINNDGQYYQGNYNVDTYISEVTDTEGVAQAEAKYNAEKVKIEHKENRIDVKMKNLDAEISSLNTEYDSVKNIINKAVEKSFKRYDA